MSKKPSLHASRANKLLSVKAELAENADTRGEESFRTSVILRESQKLALDEERLRIRREEGKSVSVTELMREAIDEWLAKRRGGRLAPKNKRPRYRIRRNRARSRA